MADTKITALTALTAADPANDVIPIVDVSDTTMAASGTTKKISVNNILGASGTATLASATITGDLTVRTNKLRVTSIGVGANTLTPAAMLHSTQSTSYDALILDSDGASTYCTANWKINGVQKAQAFLDYADDSLLIRTNTATGPLKFGCNNILQHRIDPLGVFTWFDGAGGTRMTLNSTGLGVGITPSAGNGAIQLSAGVGFPATQVASANANTLDDYEEGTFTPTIEGSTIAGIGTYSSQVGRYTKVGNLVTVQILIAWTAHTGTGSMSIASLPFTSSSASGLVASATIGYVDGIALTAGNTLIAYIQNNSSKITFIQTPTGGGSVNLVPMDIAATIAVNATYTV